MCRDSSDTRATAAGQERLAQTEARLLDMLGMLERLHMFGTLDMLGERTMDGPGQSSSTGVEDD